jgi:hypothetical protein
MAVSGTPVNFISVHPKLKFTADEDPQNKGNYLDMAV